MTDFREAFFSSGFRFAEGESDVRVSTVSTLIVTLVDTLMPFGDSTVKVYVAVDVGETSKGWPDS